MDLRPYKLKKNSGSSSELGISTSLALKCCNFSLCYPNEMIQIPTENRTPRITN